MRQARLFQLALVLTLLGAVVLFAGPAAAKKKATPPNGGPIDELQQQVAALQNSPVQGLSPYVSVVPGEINRLKGPHILFTGANVHVRSGSGATNDNPTKASPPPPLIGLGNLVVGYNDLPSLPDLYPRTGSHNFIVGPVHSYSSWGGLVAGYENKIEGTSCSVTGGNNNTAGTDVFGKASVSGGNGNEATGAFSWVGGGNSNKATGNNAAISGGVGGEASGTAASICGGEFNKAIGIWSAVLGGQFQAANTNFQTIPALP
jgi:hypothetical protein